MYIIKYDWLIALYLFTPLSRNTSFPIIKHSCVREELSDVVFFFRQNFNKSLCKNIFLVSLRLCTSPLVCAPPQLTLSLHLPPLQRPIICAVDNFQRLIFGNSQSPDNFTGKPKIVSLPTSSQESVNRNQHLCLHLHCAPSMRSMSQPDILNGVDLPPIMTQSSPHCCSTRRITFRN